MSNSTLESKIARLTAVEDISNLKATYCGYCDAQYDPDGLASRVVEDGVWDGGPEFGKPVGLEAIRTVFRGASGSIVFAAHLVMNPLIEVDGDSAHGKWRLIMPCTVNNDAGVAEARWLLSAYDEQYVRHNDTWLFKSMIVDSQFFATHADGWAQQTS
mgnify:CR=1 FL=1